MSLLSYFYGYGSEELKNLTLAQFRARFQDIAEIRKMFEGGGKGRTKMDVQTIRERRAQFKATTEAKRKQKRRV